MAAEAPPAPPAFAAPLLLALPLDVPLVLRPPRLVVVALVVPSPPLTYGPHRPASWAETYVERGGCVRGGEVGRGVRIEGGRARGRSVRRLGEV